MATYFRFDSAIRAFLEGELDTREVVGLLREAAALAKRYEDAPVGECVAGDFEGYERPTWHVIDDREAVPLTLRGRVRILLDTEGV